MPVKGRAGPVSQQVAGVVATRLYNLPFVLLIWLFAHTVSAGVLPPDRADILYHAYDGGGVQVNGPSILVQKSIGSSFSMNGNYYVDNVTSASIDVVTTASPYTEQRKEWSLGGSYLYGKSTMSLSYTSSSESDYDAKTGAFTLSQDLFHDLTTVALTFIRGDNIVRQNGNPEFQDTAQLQSYRVSISQILTKNMILGAVFETITDQGYLNNPYRSVRYEDPTSGKGFSYQPEVYPRTRVSNAGALRLRYYLPYRAAVYGGFRLFGDSWGIDASDYDVGYTHTIKERWLLDFNYRYYSQTKASFYSDLFPYRDAQNFLARDKELSTYSNQTFGVELSYGMLHNGWGFLNRATINLAYNYIIFDYKDFRDVRESTPATVGSEPLYSFPASVVRLYASFWF